MTPKNIIISLFLIITIGLAAWTTLSYHSPTLVTTNTEQPDAYMENVSATIMNKQGKVELKIMTPKMTHYAKNNSSDFIEPQLTIFRNSSQPWYISSQYAKAMNGTEILHFWDNVIIHHAADQNTSAMVIKTSTLNVYPDKKTAETDAAISMSQPNLVVHGIGMFADINAGDIKLLSNARGEYVPNP
ncbi:MAG: hypothetical protein ACD_46C00306G0004 [uncultured bacterium]|nr:MAG: hypothetical protein ACD_46C00306G0004 [uncultured bacterium]